MSEKPNNGVRIAKEIVDDLFASTSATVPPAPDDGSTPLERIQKALATLAPIERAYIRGTNEQIERLRNLVDVPMSAQPIDMFSGLPIVLIDSKSDRSYERLGWRPITLVN